MRVHCQKCGTVNNINPEKGRRDKLCVKCRAIISRAGRHPNPKWEEEKTRRAAERSRQRTRGRMREVPLTLPEQMLLRMHGRPRIIIDGETTVQDRDPETGRG